MRRFLCYYIPMIKDTIRVLIVLTFLMNAGHVYASKVDMNREIEKPNFIRQSAEFDISLGKVDKIKGQFVTTATFDIQSGREHIAFWKIKGKCKPGVVIYVYPHKQDVCKTKVEDFDVVSNVRHITIINNTQTNAYTELRFKAFGTNRKWVGNEKVSMHIPTY